jgi:hypothetical protein
MMHLVNTVSMLSGNAVLQSGGINPPGGVLTDLDRLLFRIHWEASGAMGVATPNGGRSVKPMSTVLAGATRLYSGLLTSFSLTNTNLATDGQ